MIKINYLVIKEMTIVCNVLKILIKVLTNKKYHLINQFLENLVICNYNQLLITTFNNNLAIEVLI